MPPSAAARKMFSTLRVSWDLFLQTFPNYWITEATEHTSVPPSKAQGGKQALSAVPQRTGRCGGDLEAASIRADLLEHFRHAPQFFCTLSLNARSRPVSARAEQSQTLPLMIHQSVGFTALVCGVDAAVPMRDLASSTISSVLQSARAHVQRS